LYKGRTGTLQMMHHTENCQSQNNFSLLFYDNSPEKKEDVKLSTHPEDILEGVPPPKKEDSGNNLMKFLQMLQSIWQDQQALYINNYTI